MLVGAYLAFVAFVGTLVYRLLMAVAGFAVAAALFCLFFVAFFNIPASSFG